MADCSQLANARLHFATMTNVTNMKRDSSRTDLEIDFIGACAELAVAKLFKIDINRSIVGVDSGIDLFYGDVGIDVKSTFHAGGRMLFKSVDAFKADVCVLATATEHHNAIDVVGWLSRKEFKEKAQPFTMGGHSSGMAVEQKNLHPLKDLWHGLVVKHLSGGK